MQICVLPLLLLQVDYLHCSTDSLILYLSGTIENWYLIPVFYFRCNHSYGGLEGTLKLFIYRICYSFLGKGPLLERMLSS